MPMLIQCDNKKCRQNSEATIDIKANTVHCAKCGESITAVTEFSKVALKSMNQVKKDTEAQSFAVKCTSCTKQGTPYLKDGKAFCSSCKGQLNLADSFIQMLKLFAGR